MQNRQKRDSYEFRTYIGKRLHKKLTDLAGEWDLPLTEYVRTVLLNHVREEEIKQEDEPDEFIPFGA